MIDVKDFTNQIFNIKSEADFEKLTMKAFQYQSITNPVYKKYLEFLSIDIESIHTIFDIPFLPIEFFKTDQVISGTTKHETVFTSSGTTGMQASKHYIKDLALYETSFLNTFKIFYGNPQDFVILGLLPSYLERGGSSLIYMVNKLIEISNQNESGFYLNNYEDIIQVLQNLEDQGRKTIVIGVSYALLDLIEKQNFKLKNTIIIETGGMKGRRKEMIKSELHKVLKAGFGVDHIHSEYGMTELLSQAYAQKKELFYCPPWMKILIRDPYDPFTYLSDNKSGGINIIDLANIHSCSFIETKDLGKLNDDSSFQVLGRFDNSDIRGCNLLVN